MRGKLTIAAGLLALATAFGAAKADVSLSTIGMGHGAPSPEEFRRFQTVARQYNASGERFHIDMHCPSACTMFLSIRNVCITPGATLAFHAGGGQRRGVDPYFTGQMLAAYKPSLRSYLIANRVMEGFDFHSISGAEMVRRFGYKAC